MTVFSINFLDHVAIRVKDVKASANWYEKVLGLRKYEKDAWTPFPILMLSGKSGIALFPAIADDPVLDQASKNVKIDHFAFNVDNANFNKAKRHFIELGVNFESQDHQYFQSIYIKDPDGHTVELTTLMVDEESFYKWV